MRRIPLQGKVTAREYERVKHHAQRRGISISEWVREQALFGIEADDEAEAEQANRGGERKGTAPQGAP